MLGPLRVTRSGESLRLGGHQQRVVLALLLAESGGVVSVGRLADALWGERTPGGFVTTVQTYVFHLREVLEPARLHGVPGRVLVTEPGGYRLDTSGSTVDAALFKGALTSARHAVDRGEFEQASADLQQALGLWRGEVLADMSDLGFVAPHAARLEEMRQTAQALRIEAELAMGLHADALPEIDGLVAEHPLWEQLQAQRITALYRSGRQSDALAAYRELRNRLGAELGIEPSARLQELHQAVLNQAAALDWQGPRPGVVEPAPLPLGKGPDQPEAQTTEPPRPEAPAGFVPFSPADRWPPVALPAAAVLVVAILATTIALVWLPGSAVSFPGNSIGSINADGSLGPSVPVGQSPDGLTYAADSLWAANRSDNTLSRIDPDSGGVQTIAVGLTPVALTKSDRAVWVANFGDNTVSRINVATSGSVGEPIRVGAGPLAIASGPSGIWVANSGDDTIQRIDPATGQADKAVRVGSGPDAIAIDDTSIWVSNALDGTVVEFYPIRSNGAWLLEPGRSVKVEGGPGGISLTPTDVWVASRLSQTVTRINRATLKTVAIHVGDGPHFVLASGGGSMGQQRVRGNGHVDRPFVKRGPPAAVDRGRSPRHDGRPRRSHLGGVGSLRRPPAQGWNPEGLGNVGPRRAGRDRPGSRD